MRVKLCRPPEGARDVERLNADGTWSPDDGRPAVAFSWLDAQGFPRAGAVLWPRAAGLFDTPLDLAILRTSQRFGAANGEDLPEVKS